MKNTSVHLKENTFDKTSVPKRKYFWKEVKTLLKRTSIPNRKKVKNKLWKKKLLLKNTSLSIRKQFWKILLYLKVRKNSTSGKMTSEKDFCT